MQNKSPIIKYVLIVLLVAIIFGTLYFLNQQVSQDQETVYTILTYTAAAVFLICFIAYLIKAGILGLVRYANARIILGLGIVALLIVALGIAGLASVDKRDIKLIDDSDLTLNTYTLTDQDNIYPELVNMTDNLKTNLESLGSNTEWGTNQSLEIDAINNILADNKIVMDNFENALHKKGYHEPSEKSSIEHHNDIYLYYNDPNIRTAFIVAKIQQLKVSGLLNISYDKGKINFNNAFDEAIKIIIFGDILAKSPLTPADNYNALKIKKIGLDTAKYVIEKSVSATNGKNKYINWAWWSQDDYQRMAGIVQAYQNDNLGAALVVKKLYADEKNFIQSGKVGASPPSYFGNGINYYFKPNKTIALQADIAREYLKSTGDTCTESVPQDQYLPTFTKLRAEDLYHKTSLLKENLKGKLSVDASSGSLLELNYRRCQSQQEFDQMIRYIKDFLKGKTITNTSATEE